MSFFWYSLKWNLQSGLRNQSSRKHYFEVLWLPIHLSLFLSHCTTQIQERTTISCIKSLRNNYKVLDLYGSSQWLWKAEKGRNKHIDVAHMGIWLPWCSTDGLLRRPSGVPAEEPSRCTKVIIMRRRPDWEKKLCVWSHEETHNNK